LSIGADARRVLAATHGRIVGATTDEVSAAAAVLDAVLDHPLVLAARAAEADGRCHRELPVTMLDGDTVLEGVADLVFEQGGVMTVVDFKTDRADPSGLSRYARQVRAYAAAIQRATGKPARPILMEV
jgi:ATP-dependent exoDNAse (exonuclease V) beta subunit